MGSVGMFFLNRLKAKFAEDEEGFFPNASFTDLYCETFEVREKPEVQAALPDFIKNRLGVDDYEKQESLSKNQI